MIISDNEAIEKILNGGIVALPTDTVYGLSAKIECEIAIKKIFDLKKRPLSSPLITLIADINTLIDLTLILPPNTIHLAYAFWPGPLTMVLPVNPLKVPSIVRAGENTCAFRIPANKELLAIIQKTGPIVSTSANITQTPSTTDPKKIEEAFGKDFPIVEKSSDSPLIGVESTLIAYEDSRWKILRNGAIPPNHFTAVLGYDPEYICKKK